MQASQRLLVRVNDDLMLDVGTCERIGGPGGVERVVRPPQTSLFRQVLDYLRAKPDSEWAAIGADAGREGIAAAAVTVRWGSYFAVLADRAKPAWDAAASPHTSCISDEEMARINTGGTGACCRADSQCRSNDCFANDCRPLAAVGDRCDNGRLCASGRRCDTGPTSQGTGRCIPDDGEGEDDQFCSHDRQCLDGHACRTDPGVNYGACVSRQPLRAECSHNSGCLSGACDVSARRCVPISGTGGTDAYCTADFQCVSNDCLLNACRSLAAIGQVCDTGRRCAGARRCDVGEFTQNTGRCIPDDREGTPGQFCSHNNQCLPGHACELLPGRNYGDCS